MRLGILLMCAAVICAADSKKPPAAEASNGKIAIKATLLSDKDAIARELGSDLGGYFTVVRVEVTPKGGPLQVYRDDFLLRSYNDGQKSGPFAPSQIAGRGALVISSRGTGGGIVSEDRGPVWGGIPGTGGRPERMPGSSGGIGNAGGATEVSAQVNEGRKEKENPLLAVLKQKELPEKETAEPIAGLLYFSLDGKHKPKQLAVQYTGSAGKLTLEFR